jgi:hypothetical protein
MRPPVNRIHGCNVKAPITYHLGYLTIITLVGYALGVTIVNPFDDLPTGFASASNAWDRYKATNSSNVDDFLSGIKRAASPPGHQDGPRVTATGFEVIIPLTGTANVSQEGTLTLKFLKPLPTEIDMTGFEITNARTGVRCGKVDSETCLPSNQDSFSVSAEGCDTRIAEQDHGVLTYDIRMSYGVKIGSVSSKKSNSGQLRVWL